jgi:hypothetical protein
VQSSKCLRLTLLSLCALDFAALCYALALLYLAHPFPPPNRVEADLLPGSRHYRVESVSGRVGAGGGMKTNPQTPMIYRTGRSQEELR